MLILTGTGTEPVAFLDRIASAQPAGRCGVVWLKADTGLTYLNLIRSARLAGVYLHEVLQHIPLDAPGGATEDGMEALRAHAAFQPRPNENNSLPLYIDADAYPLAIGQLVRLGDLSSDTIPAPAVVIDRWVPARDPLLGVRYSYTLSGRTSAGRDFQVRRAQSDLVLAGPTVDELAPLSGHRRARLAALLLRHLPWHANGLLGAARPF